MDVAIYLRIAGKDLCNALLEINDNELVLSSVLLTHLCCENIAEGWICAHCNNLNLFDDEDSKIRVDFYSKIKIAKNLKLPKSAYNFFKTINRLRNGLAHQTPGQKTLEIPDSTINSLSDNLKNLASEYNPPHWNTQYFHLKPNELAAIPNHRKIKMLLAELFGIMMQIIMIEYKDDFIKFMNPDNQPDLH
ncbi:hypothetical protein ADQ49_26415 [Salmonella enterica subsp. enterica]|nr:hypothetical protein [Salmonella enterica subsp. enterica serovar Enteritidis]